MRGTYVDRSISLVAPAIGFSREHVSAAIKREFMEEAMNSNEEGAKHVDELFKHAKSVKKHQIRLKSIFLWSA